MSKTNVRIERCDHCGSVVSKREIVIFKSLIYSLWTVYKRCIEMGINNFSMKEIRDLLGRNEYARFGDLVLFGHLVTKEGKARYRLNMELCEKFFANKLFIPIKILKDPVTGKIEIKDLGKIGDIPKLKDLLDKDQMYITTYQL
jgi:hypothetical protein